jgi:hypothetical protein
MRRWFTLIFLVALAIASGAAAPMYETSAGWEGSGLQGHAEGKATFWTSKPGATATWRPAFDGPVRARVYFHKIVAARENDPDVPVTIRHAGKSDVVHVNCADGKSGWVPLGEFDFAGGGDDEAVALARTSRAGMTRISAVRFDVLGEGARPGVIQSLTLDEPTGGPLAEDETFVPKKVNRDPSAKRDGPPAGGAWKLEFEENFDGDTLDATRWAVESGAPSHILSSRWPENVVVRGGVLHLLTRKQSRGGKQWTTGNLWTRTYKPQYGYFEARMRLGKATGLNNAFWLMTENAKGAHHFEIDITEARYPNKSAMTVHNWKDGHTASGSVFAADEDLSADFHVYGALWTADEIVWYLDGAEVRRVKHDYCRAPSPVRLSSAVGRFAGRITDALDGTEMEVDWVRVYRNVSATGPAPSASPPPVSSRGER